MNADSHRSETRPGFVTRSLAAIYRGFGYFGLFSVLGVLIYGFRHEATAPASGYAFNALLYAAFILPHVVMTRSWLKRAIWRNPAGSPAERRVYITISVLTWLAVFYFHRPVPGFTPEWPAWTSFIGIVCFLFSATLFFQGVTFAMIDGLLAVPGAATAFSHGPDTPLFTDGPYASVRHPQYRAFFMAGASSLLIHPNAAQLFWLAMLGATFLAFIPVEEAQLLRQRGDDYRAYKQRTPWRLFRGIW